MGKIALYLVLLMMMHPLHLAIIHIYDEQDTIKITVKVFKDDLEKAIYHSEKKEVKADNLNVGDKVYIFNYIDKHFEINTNNNLLNLKPDTIIVEPDVAVIKFVGRNPMEKNYWVKCSIFNELFNDQTNLVMVKFGEFEKGYRMTGSKQITQISIE